MDAERSARDEKFARILRTAAKVFAERGYHRASIRDISRATGVSLSGLYYYFESKQELLFLIQDHGFGTVLHDLEDALDDVDDPEQRLRVLIDSHLRFFVNNMEEMKVLSHEAESLEGEYRDRINAKKKRYTRICTSILEALQPPEGGIDLRVATFSLFGMMNWIYTWYRHDRDIPVDALADDMSRIFLRGFTAPADGAAMGATPDARGRAQPSIWR